MRDRPTPEELLHGARIVLDRDITPSLAGPQRFAAMLISRAMAVAGRAIANGDGPLLAEAQRLQALVDVRPAAETNPETLSGVLLERNRLLVQQIRSGAFDAGLARQQLFEHLRQVTRVKLSENNPRYFDLAK